MAETPERRRYPAMALLRWLRAERRLGTRLSSSAADVLAIIAGYVSVDGVAWPSLATLAADTGMSERSVQRAIRELRDHKRPALRQELGVHHEAPSYVVTDWAYMAHAQRGPYSSVEAAPPPPKAAGVEADAPALDAGLDAPGGTTTVTPLKPAGTTRLSSLRPGGTTTVTPLRPGGTTNLSQEGRQICRAHKEELPIERNGVERTAAAAVRSEQQQQPVDRSDDQRPEDRAEAERLLATILAARARREDLRAELSASGDVPESWQPLRSLTTALVLADATAFQPDARSARVVRHTRLERLSGPWLERSLVELRQMAAAEARAAEHESAEAERVREERAIAARERADDADAGLPGVEESHRAAAQGTWALISAVPSSGPLHVAREDLRAVALIGERLLVRAPRRGLGWLAAELDRCAAHVGLTCRAVVGTYGELREALLRAPAAQPVAPKVEHRPAAEAAVPGPASRESVQVDFGALLVGLNPELAAHVEAARRRA